MRAQEPELAKSREQAWPVIVIKGNNRKGEEEEYNRGSSPERAIERRNGKNFKNRKVCDSK